MKRLLVVPALLAFLSCGGGGGDGGGGGGPDPTPNPADQVEGYARDVAVDVLAAVVDRVAGIFQLLLDPDERAAAGIVFAPDTSPGAAPNTWLYEAPYDANGDGTPDATATGRVTFTEPFAAGVGLGFGGTVEFEADLGEAGTVEALVDFVLTLLGLEVTGVIDVDEPPTGSHTTLTVPDGDPLLLKKGHTDANLCTADAQGPIDVEMKGPIGEYAALWEFFLGTRSVQVTNRTFLDGDAPAGTPPTDLPGTTVVLPSCDPPAIEDWEGTFILEWFCDPPEGGTSRLTFEVTGPDTVHVSDEHPVGSGQTIEFDATADPGSPHVLRGFFLDTESDGTYREDVILTLAPSRNRWTQNNVYTYIDGPNEGSGGTCGGLGTRR